MDDARACRDCGTAVDWSAFVVRRTSRTVQSWCHECWTLRGIARATLGLPEALEPAPGQDPPTGWVDTARRLRRGR